MRVAAVQFRAQKGDRAGSLGALVSLAERAGVGADLVVLPEMAATGYVFPDRDAVRAVSEPAQGPTLAALAPVARGAGCWVVAGFPESDGDRLYNSALVIGPDGRLAFTYRKTLLYDADLPWATPGDSGYRTFDTGAGRFGVGICMDLNDDAFTGWVRAERPEVLAFPTNWVAEPEPTVDVWGYWAWRLDGTGTALVAANTWGEDGPIRFTGRSCVLRDRVVHCAAPERGDGVLGPIRVG